MRRVALIVVPVLAAFGLTAVLVAAPAADAATSTAPKLVYVPVSPARIENTTTGADGNRKGALPAGQGTSPTVTNVPTSAVAVAITLTAFDTTAAGALVTYAYGAAKPLAAMLQFVKGQSVSESVIVPMASHKINIANTGTSGSTQLLVDVTGYYKTYTGGSSVGLTHVLSPPVRVVDTTKGTDGNYKGVVASQTAIHPVVTGFAGTSPTATTGEVIASVSVINATASGSILAYGSSLPTESSLHFDAGRSASALVIVPTDSAGHIALYNNSGGTVNLKVDVEGWVQEGPAEIAGSFEHLPLTRQISAQSVSANGNYSKDLHGLGGIPLAASQVSAVWATVQVSGGTAAGTLTVETAGTSPGIRTLTYAKGQNVSSSVLVPLSSSGYVTIHNGSTGKVSVYLDIYGYIAGNTPTTPATSRGRYVRDITSTDTASMLADGKADRGNRLVVLEFGAQTDDQAGVQLTTIDAPQGDVSYAGVQEAVAAYLSGLGDSATPVVVALGTNNDADSTAKAWTHFSPTARAQRWAALVKAVTAPGLPSNVTVEGADDIEPGFYSDQTQAAQWVSAYTTSGAGTLIYNGSADGCPTTIGSTADCNFTWTLKQIYAMAHAANTVVLPQIYNTLQADQWANIDIAGGRALNFAGVLTEFAADSSTSQTAVQGWTALYRTLSSVTSAASSLPGPVDLTIDS